MESQIGIKVSIQQLLKKIDELGSYPVIEFNDKYFSIHTKPTSHHVFADGSIGFQINDGSLHKKKPQMICFKLDRTAEIIETDTSLHPSVTTIKTYFVKSSIDNYHAYIYFPKHLT